MPLSRACRRCLAAALVPVLLPLVGCGRSGTGDASQVVAQVNDGEISVHQLNQRLQQLGGVPSAAQAQAAGRDALEGLIEQEIAVQKAVELKLDRDPDVLLALAAARRETLARAYAGRLAAAATLPDADAVRKYFDSNPERFSRRRLYELQELVVPATPVQMERLRARLATARKADEVVAFLRTEGMTVQASRTTQGPESIARPLLERIEQMRDGQAVLLAVPGGARIVILVGSRDAPVSFEQARPVIEQGLLAERRQEAVRVGMETARRASRVSYRGSLAPAGSASATAAASVPAAAVAPTPQARQAGHAADAEAVSKGLAGLR